MSHLDRTCQMTSVSVGRNPSVEPSVRQRRLLHVLVAASALMLAACSENLTDNALNPLEETYQTSSPLTRSTTLERTEAALYDQIKCEEPPQAGVAMTAMIHNGLIRETDDGGDGIVLFVPRRSVKLLGFEIVRLGGWQPGKEGGAMPPFARGPGTAPPNHIAVTVRASAPEVERALAKLGIEQGRYVPDLSEEPWTDSNGEIRQPQRFVPGPTVRSGDYDDGGYVQKPLSSVATIECSANEYDFEREAEAGARR